MRRAFPTSGGLALLLHSIVVPRNLVTAFGPFIASRPHGGLTRGRQIFRANPGKQWDPVSGMLRKTLAGLAGVVKDVSVDVGSLAEPPGMTTWEELAAQLADAQTEGERGFRAGLAAGTIEANSAKCNLRLFDAPEGEEPRITFYRDSASWCPYCHKVATPPISPP